jgi:hypothetical protein
LLNGGVTYKRGSELPPGVLSGKIAEAYEKLGWITGQDPDPAEDVVEPPKPAPQPIQVEKEVSPAAETPIQVEKDMGPIPDAEEVVEDVSSGPKKKSKKSRKGKRHG